MPSPLSQIQTELPQRRSPPASARSTPPPPPASPSSEIIKKFGERESLFTKARENYTFRQSVKVDTISEDTNRVDGEYQQVTDITFNDAGKREEHVVFAPQTLSNASS